MLSQRERHIAIFTGVMVGAFVLYQYIYQPLINSRQQLLLEGQRLTIQLDKDQKLLRDGQAAAQKIKQLRTESLRTDRFATELQFLNAVQSWSEEAGLKLTSTRPDRTVVTNELNEMAFQAVADGNIRSITRFLYNVESASIPVRIRNLTITSRSEGSGDLNMVLRVSTIWDAEGQKQTPGPRVATNRTPTTQGVQR